MNIVITGGGTGGHLSIAKALGEELKNRGHNVIYIGSINGQDKLWFKDSNIFNQCYFLESSGVVNKKGLKIIHSLYLQCKAIFKCVGIFRKHKINKTLSVGGYSAGGAAGASILCFKPLFIHEQNAVLGSLNKLLAPFAKYIFSSFDINYKNLKKTPYPINSNFFNTARDRSEIKYVLFLGGSQGATAINDFALHIACDLVSKNIKIIHQCGVKDLQRVKNKYIQLNLMEENGNSPYIELFDFDKNLVSKITKADFCISRAGASSMWELCANGLPAYYIPYPYAAKNHQYFNALKLKNMNLAEVKKQDELNKNDFFAYIESIDIKHISKSIRKLIENNGAKKIINLIES